jgi:PEP-CTERM motif
MFIKAMSSLIAGTVLFGISAAMPVQADPVFALGSTFTVRGANFPTDFGPTSATLGSATTLNGGQLTLSETFTPISSTSEWVQFDFATTSGGPLGGDLNTLFGLRIDGIQTNGPAVLTDLFVYFTANGTPFSPLTAASGFGVETNPITGSFPVLDFVGFAPGLPDQSFFVSLFSDPYDFLSDLGINPSTANDLHFAAEFTLVEAVPEPTSLSLLAVGLLAFGALRHRSSLPRKDFHKIPG